MTSILMFNLLHKINLNWALFFRIRKYTDSASIPT